MTNTTANNNTDVNMDDKQAMQALKKHGGNIVTVILLVLAGYFGYQYWQEHRNRVDEAASSLYGTIVENNDKIVLAEQNPDLADDAKKTLAQDRSKLYAQVDKLVSQHGKTIYAWQALMLKARNQADEGDYKSAAKSLEQAQAIDLDDKGLSALAQLRQAQALLAANDVDNALLVAKKPVPEAFGASQKEVLGDIYQAKKDTKAAKQAYQEAWELLRKRNENRAILSLKMQALGMDFEPIIVKSPVVKNANAQIDSEMIAQIDEHGADVETQNHSNEQPSSKTVDTDKKTTDTSK